MVLAVLDVTVPFRDAKVGYLHSTYKYLPAERMYVSKVYNVHNGRDLRILSVLPLAAEPSFNSERPMERCFWFRSLVHTLYLLLLC